MNNQINLLSQLQELVLTRDEHHQTGDGTHLETLNASIAALVDRLDMPVKTVYRRLCQKDHVVLSPMVNSSCGVCGMRLPISQVQQVRLAKTLQTCTSCGRILFNEEEDTPHVVVERPARGELRKVGIARFSAEELMICDLKGKTAAEAVRELANAMSDNKFVSNPAMLTVAAMEREAIISTAMGNGLAFPHVRGVEGGGLTLALGVSKDGIVFDGDGTKVNLVFFSVIPVAVSAFYLRLMSGLVDALSKPANCAALIATKDRAGLWKALVKVTRTSIK